MSDNIEMYDDEIMIIYPPVEKPDENDPDTMLIPREGLWQMVRTMNGDYGDSYIDDEVDEIKGAILSMYMLMSNANSPKNNMSEVYEDMIENCGHTVEQCDIAYGKLIEYGYIVECEENESIHFHCML